MNITMDEEMIRQAGWEEEELEVWREVEAFFEKDDGTEASTTLSSAFLSLARKVWERNHSSPVIKRQKKAIYLRLLLQHISRVELFPDDGEGHTRLLEERLLFLFEVWADAPQLPVIEAAAFECLELDIQEKWSSNERWRHLATESNRTNPQKTLSGISLVSTFSSEQEQAQQKILRNMPVENKTTRLEEMIRVVEAYGRSVGVRILVEKTLQTLFENTSQKEKKRLLKRLFRELDRQWSSKKDRQWHLILDPLISQNRRSKEIFGMLMALAERREGILKELHLLLFLNHLESTRVKRELVKMLAEKGTNKSLPTLTKLKDVASPTGWWRPPAKEQTPLQKEAAEAIEIIMERENLNVSMSGGLSVVDEPGGELTLLYGDSGALTLAEDEAWGLIKDSSQERPANRYMATGILAVSATVAALASLLWWLFG